MSFIPPLFVYLDDILVNLVSCLVSAGLLWVVVVSGFHRCSVIFGS